MVSVIIPIYNMEKYLPQCIDSVLNQTHTNIEVILINDGSTDSCKDICDKYKEKDHRIVVIHKNNEGLSAARNDGLRVANGEWIAFVDADDWIEANMYEKLIKMARRNNADISACRYSREYKNGIRFTNYHLESSIYNGSNEIAKGFILDCTLAPIVMNKLYKAVVLKDNFLFPVGRNYEDLCLSVFLIERGNVIAYCNKRYYHYRQRKSSIIHSHSLINAIDNWDARLERYHKLYSLPNKFKEILVKECVNAIYKMMSVALFSRKTPKYKECLTEIKSFAKIHWKCVKQYDSSKDIRIMLSIAKHNNPFVVPFVSIMHLIHCVINIPNDLLNKKKYYE